MENKAESLAELQNRVHRASFDAGWWDKTPPSSEVAAIKLALVHSEVSEALEGFRKGIRDDHLTHRLMAEVELADVIIRVLDLAGAFGFDLQSAINEKLDYNSKRDDHKAAARSAPGGKRF